MVIHFSETTTPAKHQHQRRVTLSNAKSTRVIIQSQEDISRQFENNYSRCLPVESHDALYSAISSPYVTWPSGAVNYVNQQELKSGEYEDFDWEEDRMVAYKYVNYLIGGD